MLEHFVEVLAEVLPPILEYGLLLALWLRECRRLASAWGRLSDSERLHILFISL